MIKDRISSLQSNISLICQKLGKNPEDITLVGVTKFATVEKINEAIACGLTHIGENKVQQAQKKFSHLDAPASQVKRHMIGHLQTNKLKVALELFDIIQSVDSLKLANEIHKEAEKSGRVVNILVQVNTSGEEQKYGAPKNDALALMEQIALSDRIRVLGLMTMAPFVEDHDVIRNCFRSLRELYEQASEKFSDTPNIQMKHLSMGMTDDYEIAIEEGSNMIRVGRAIFQDD